MLRILYRSGGIYTQPCLDTGILGGMVVAYAEDRSYRICDDKSFPAGFFVSDSYCGPPTPGLEVVSAVIGQAELITDVYEPGEYKLNDFLYCSPRGRITCDKQYRGHHILGVVNQVLDGQIGFVTLHARYIEDDI